MRVPRISISIGSPSGALRMIRNGVPGTNPRSASRPDARPCARSVQSRAVTPCLRSSTRTQPSCRPEGSVGHEEAVERCTSITWMFSLAMAAIHNPSPSARGSRSGRGPWHHIGRSNNAFSLSCRNSRGCPPLSGTSGREVLATGVRLLRPRPSAPVRRPSNMITKVDFIIGPKKWRGGESTVLSALGSALPPSPSLALTLDNLIG